MKNLRVTHPSEAAILSALIIASLGYITIELFIETNPNAEIRLVYLASAYLLMFDVIESAYIARGKSRNIFNPHLWIYAFYMGYFYFVAMVLMIWDGVENIGNIILYWGVAGAAFGVVIAILPDNSRANLRSRFELEKPLTNQKVGNIYFVWPTIVVFIIASFMIFPPADGWDVHYLLFQMILLGSMMPLYSFKKSNWLRNIYPRFVGFALLLITLIVFA